MRRMLIGIIVMLLLVPLAFSIRTDTELFNEAILIASFDNDILEDNSTFGLTGVIHSGSPLINKTDFQVGSGSLSVYGLGGFIDEDAISFVVEGDIINFSLSLWVHTGVNDGTGTDMNLVTHDSDAVDFFPEKSLLYSDGIDNMKWQMEATAPFNAQSGNIASALKSDTWQQFCVTLNQTDGFADLFMYRNGTELIGTGSQSETETSSSANITIGALTSTFNGWNGEIDEVYVFNTTLTSGECGRLFDLGNAGLHLVAGAVDTTIPGFGADSINNSLPRLNEDILVSQVVTDDLSLSQARVSHNQSETFVNQSLQDISGMSSNVSDTITITASKNTVVGYQWWGNDTSGNSNTSNIKTFVVQNTPPSDPTIISPTASLRTNEQPLDLTVTFPADVDGDAITINYFINGTLNQTSSFNVTFNASDGNYFLEVSIDDGTDFSSNVSVNFELDTTAPAFGLDSINNTVPKINENILVSQVVTDNALDFIVVSHNQSGLFVNQTIQDISGTSVNATDTIIITASKGTVVGYKWFSNDTLNNFDFSTIRTFTVANTPPENPTIIFPTADLRTNDQPLALNVTFPADVDGDTININFYINGTLNSTSTSNGTFTASDGLYRLNVSIDDGTDSSPGNDTVDFEVDTVNPVIVIISPIDLSTQTGNFSVNLTCTDSNPFILNYTLFNSSFDLLKTVQDSTPVSTLLEINDDVDITDLNMPDADYQLNITCADTHTRSEIPEYDVFDVGDGKRFITPNGVDVRIIHLGLPIQNLGVNADPIDISNLLDGVVNGFSFVMEVPQNSIKSATHRRLIDRYTFEFGTTPTRQNETFKVITAKHKIQIIDSGIKGHLIISSGLDGNWIDFENGDDESVVTVERISDKQVNVHVFSNDFNFKSIGGLNVVTEVITFTLDTSEAVPAITALAVFPLEDASTLIGMVGLFIIIFGLIFGRRALINRKK